MELINLLTSTQTPETIKAAVELRSKGLIFNLGQIANIFLNENYKQNANVMLQLLLYLKNCLVSKDPFISAENKKQWKSLQFNQKQFFHERLLELLNSPPAGTPQTLAEVISIIASYDLEDENWGDLFECLLNTSAPPQTQAVSILVLGLLFEKIPESVLSNHLSRILPVLSDLENTNLYKYRLEALHKLLNYKSFCTNQLNLFLDIVVNISPNEIEETLNIKLDILSTVIEKYIYSLRGQHDYISNFLIGLGEKYKQNEDLVKKIYSVWSIIGNVELEEKRAQTDIIKSSSNKLFSQISGLMIGYCQTEMDDDDDDGENQNSVTYALKDTLYYITKIVGEQFVVGIYRDVFNGLQSTNPQQVYISLNILSEIIQGTESDGSSFKDGITLIIKVYSTSSEDPILLAASRALIQILETIPDVIDQQCVNLLIQATNRASNSGNEVVVVTAFSIIKYLIKNIEDKTVLSQNFSMLYEKINKGCTLYDKENIQKSALLCMNELAENIENLNNKNFTPVIAKTAFALIQESSNRKKPKAVAHSINILSSIIRNLEVTELAQCNINPQATIQIFFQFLTNSDVFDAAMDGIVSIAESLGQQFSPFLPNTINLLKQILSDYSQQDLVLQASEKIGELARCTGAAITPYSQDLVKTILSLVNLDSFDVQKKFTLLLSVGRIGQAIGFNNFMQIQSGSIEYIQAITSRVIQYNIDINTEDGAELFEHMVYSILTFYSYIIPTCNSSFMQSFPYPLGLIKHCYQIMTTNQGKLNTDKLFGKFADFLKSIVINKEIFQNPQLRQQVFDQQIVAILNSALNNTSDPTQLSKIKNVCRLLGLQY
ncbi:hypothetical protein QTN25_005527 [Entamoeba marina]